MSTPQFHELSVAAALRATKCPRCFWDEWYGAAPRYRRPPAHKQRIEDVRQALHGAATQAVDPALPPGRFRYEDRSVLLPPVTYGRYTITLNAKVELVADFEDGTTGLYHAALLVRATPSLETHHGPRMAVTADAFVNRPARLGLLAVITGPVRVEGGGVCSTDPIHHIPLQDEPGLSTQAAKFVAVLLSGDRPAPSDRCTACHA